MFADIKTVFESRKNCSSVHLTLLVMRKVTVKTSNASTLFAVPHNRFLSRTKDSVSLGYLYFDTKILELLIYF